MITHERCPSVLVIETPFVDCPLPEFETLLSTLRPFVIQLLHLEFTPDFIRYVMCKHLSIIIWTGHDFWTFFKNQAGSPKCLAGSTFFSVSTLHTNLFHIYICHCSERSYEDFFIFVGFLAFCQRFAHKTKVLEI